MAARRGTRAPEQDKGRMIRGVQSQQVLPGPSQDAKGGAGRGEAAGHGRGAPLTNETRLMIKCRPLLDASDPNINSAKLDISMGRYATRIEKCI